MWFSTRQHETEVYGPCQFEFNFNRVLEAYQRNRGRKHKICYRAAGTLVYEKEVSHIVLICCMDDEEHETLPLITKGKTIYFTPPVKLDSTNSNPDAGARVRTNEYCNRHEHVFFAIYQPKYQKLCMSIEDGILRLTPHNYCIPSKKKACKFAHKQTLTINKLYTYASWLTSPAKSLTPDITNYEVNKSYDGFEHPMLTNETDEHKQSTSTKLDEKSFDWQTDTDNKECYDQVDALSQAYDHSSENVGLADGDRGHLLNKNGFDDWLVIQMILHNMHAFMYYTWFFLYF